jgi:competence protein ComEC
MNDASVRALRPLWMLATGVVAGTIWARSVTQPGSGSLHGVLILLGIAAAVAGTAGRRRCPWLIWLLAGLALAGGRGLQAAGDRLALEERVATVSNLALRIEATVKDGWSQARWGWQAQVVVEKAVHRQSPVNLPGTCRLEVRGAAEPWSLPDPGTRIAVLATVRGEPHRPLLVASSARLLTEVAAPTGLPRLRDWLAQSLLKAAGTDLQRVRAAELAAVLTVGRRDLLPAERRQGWRRSGMAHLLAVSGLHVGLLAAAVWLLATLVLGLGPTASRWLVLLVLPAYALLAGAAPSAVRAALMGMTYLGARLLGRALLPMAAVLLAAAAMLLYDPTLVADVGFQLTVVITAALVRWAPVMSEWLPGSRWLSATLAVPLIAQATAAPIVGWHFRTAIPGAVIANLAVPLLMAPALLVSLAAVMVAPLWLTGAAWLLDLLSLLERCLWWCGAPGRAAELVVPATPLLLVVTLVVSGWLALQAGSKARYGAAAWIMLIIAGGAWHLLRPGPAAGQVILMPVSDGAAALLPTSSGTVLFDGGRYRYEAAELLADAGVGRLEMVLASHADEDHIGGLERVILTRQVEQLVLPAWMLGDPTAVPLLRAARRRHTRVIPVVRGSAIRSGDSRFEVLWPPLVDPPADENDRSLVVRLRLPQGVVVLTSDVSRQIEARLAGSLSLRCDVLVAPHHGSKSSTSPALLDAAGPAVVLIPAGKSNTHGHPHPLVLNRIAARRVPIRFPARDGWCGARPDKAIWRAFP